MNRSLVKYLLLLSVFAFACQKDKTPRKLELNLTYKGFSTVPIVNVAGSDALDPVIENSGNAITLSPLGVVYPGMDSILYDLSGFGWGDKTTGISKMLVAAHSKNMSVMVNPRVEFQDNVTTTAGYSGASEAEWLTFESSYVSFMVHFAHIADSLGAEVFCVGNDFENFVALRPDFWSELIDTLRYEFSGKLTYAANWNSYQAVPFWSDLDYIGINAFFAVSDEATPTVDEIEQGWTDDIIPGIETFQTSVGIPVIFTEYGYRSMNYCAVDPSDADTIFNVNETAQENCLLGMFNAFDKKSWFEGGFIRGWDLENPTAGGSADIGYTVQNKSAEHLLYILFRSN